MGPAIKRTLLFVYGTLKRGEKNASLIRDQRFLREAVTPPKYRLYDLGPYPGLVRDEANGLAVVGELWEVSDCCLGELDDFETDEYVRARADRGDRRGGEGRGVLLRGRIADQYEER